MSSPNESTASRLQRIGRRTDAIPEQADRFQDEVLLEDAFVVSEDNNNLEPEESEQNNSDHQGIFREIEFQSPKFVNFKSLE